MVSARSQCDVGQQAEESYQLAVGVQDTERELVWLLGSTTHLFHDSWAADAGQSPELLPTIPSCT